MSTTENVPPAEPPRPEPFLPPHMMGAFRGRDWCDTHMHWSEDPMVSVQRIHWAPDNLSAPWVSTELTCWRHVVEARLANLVWPAPADGGNDGRGFVILMGGPLDGQLVSAGPGRHLVWIDGSEWPGRTHEWALVAGDWPRPPSHARYVGKRDR